MDTNFHQPNIPSLAPVTMTTFVPKKLSLSVMAVDDEEVEDIILACRSESKTLHVMENIRSKSSNKYAMMEFIPLDLSDLNSVRNCAKLFLEKEIPLHALVCNAGVWPNEYYETKQGFEMTYGVNHLGHFLLVNLLLDKLKESAPARVVIVSSMAHKYGNIAQLLSWAKSKEEAKQQFSTQQTYSNSKLANVLFAYGLARRLNENTLKPQSDVSVVAIHPGVVNTKLFDSLWGGFVSVLGSLFFESPEHASLALVYHAVHPQTAGLTGMRYYSQWKEEKSLKGTYEQKYQDELWDVSSQQVGGLSM
ncbi:hypothetical protein C9374_013403 [Naegleria lovaniensis]|uniref:Uncharacterized protein n=1 Tax=Naegleria lovaniensis TaxID=51637 RepID=A0AA88GZ97_NAELO|nr:uncharacterized protein C9374_013403 [Naegleria lovaniensis]KAG2391918.1 hypothetical protein C9374_013403 [Naegleria lovaniensis]